MEKRKEKREKESLNIQDRSPIVNGALGDEFSTDASLCVLVSWWPELNLGNV